MLENIAKHALQVEALAQAAQQEGRYKLAMDLFEVASQLAFTVALHTDAAANSAQYQHYKQVAQTMREQKFAAADLQDKLDHPEDYV